MNTIEADAIIEYMRKIWPAWDPHEEEVKLWEYEFKFHDEQVAMRAVREAYKLTNFSKPPTKDINNLMKRYKPVIKKLGTQQDDPTYFLMFYGNGRSKLQAGYYQPVNASEGMSDSEAAEIAKKAMFETHGGDWRVFQGSSYSDMNKIREELRADLVNI